MIEYSGAYYKDFSSYQSALREQFAHHGSEASPEGEIFPAVNCDLFDELKGRKSSEKKRVEIGPQNSTQLSGKRSFEAVGYKKESLPKVRRVDAYDRPLLTTGVMECTMAWFTATDRAETKGIHALAHSYPNRGDPGKVIQEVTDGFKQDGFGKPGKAFVVGGSVKRSEYGRNYPRKDEIEDIKSNSQKILSELKRLGYEVLDMTGENRPYYANNRSNIGGKMNLEKGKIVFEFVADARYD